MLIADRSQFITDKTNSIKRNHAYKLQLSHCRETYANISFVKGGTAPRTVFRHVMKISEDLLVLKLV